jgi:hypothetical protein
MGAPMLPEPVRRAITIQVGFGNSPSPIPRTAAADVYADAWAIHETNYGGGWTVTHVPSGYSAQSGMPKARARRLVRDLLKLQPAEAWLRMYIKRGRTYGISRANLAATRDLVRAIYEGR